MRSRLFVTCMLMLASLACNLPQAIGNEKLAEYVDMLDNLVQQLSPTQQVVVAEQTPSDIPQGTYLAVDQSSFYQGSSSECWYDPQTESSQLLDDDGFAVFPSPQDGSPDAPLYFTIIVHIEPQSNYKSHQRYQVDRDRLTRFAQMVAAHGGALTIQTQRPFITTSRQVGDDVHRQWQAMGHEVAIHFHENEYIKGAPGQFGADVPISDWIAALGGLKVEIETLIDGAVLNWSGGNLYSELWQVAQTVGLKVNTNFKDPSNQQSDPRYFTVSPWRPVAPGTGPLIQDHDPLGPVIYIPAGVYPAHCQKAAGAPRPYTSAALDYLTTALINSLQAARPGYVNSFYTTIHPGDFMNPNDDDAEFARWDEWLTTVIDPLVADGRLVWSTASQTAKAFETWDAEQ